MRTILHSDLNNFYASVACLQNPSLRKVPMAVCGDPRERHGIVLSKNELAKAAGVKTAEAIWQAQQKCPGLVTVGVDFAACRRLAAEARKIYREYTDRVEPFGLDEAWLDISDLGADGREVADELRARLRRELGLTVSVGVSFNKVFAKLASDLKKPDATSCVTMENFRQVVWPLPTEALLYVGPATRRKLLERNIRTIGDLAARPPGNAARHARQAWGNAVDVCKRPGKRAGCPLGRSVGGQIHWQQHHPRARPGQRRRRAGAVRRALPVRGRTPAAPRPGGTHRRHFHSRQRP